MAVITKEIDRIFLQQLTVMARIGVLEHERRSAQPLSIDLELATDLRPAGLSGRLVDTIDYAELARQLAERCMAEHIDLVETLAEALAMHCLADKRIRWVKLRLGKPQALSNCVNVGVMIHRIQPLLTEREE
jgi:dihydroneopterin aldolase